MGRLAPGPCGENAEIAVWVLESHAVLVPVRVMRSDAFTAGCFEPVHGFVFNRTPDIEDEEVFYCRCGRKLWAIDQF